MQLRLVEAVEERLAAGEAVAHDRERLLDLASEEKRVDQRRAMVVVRALKAGPLEPGETLPDLRSAVREVASSSDGPSLRAERRRRPGAAD